MPEKTFLKAEQIPLNTMWYSCDGSGHKVKVVYIDIDPPGWVGYEWQEKGKTITHEKSSFAFQCRYYLPDETMKIWPKIGDKVRYIGVKPIWFKEIAENAKNNLEIGKEYTLAKITPLSSWCSVLLEEQGDKLFALSFFEYVEKQTEKELAEDENQRRMSGISKQSGKSN